MVEAFYIRTIYVLFNTLWANRIAQHGTNVGILVPDYVKKIFLIFNHPPSEKISLIVILHQAFSFLTFITFFTSPAAIFADIKPYEIFIALNFLVTLPLALVDIGIRELISRRRGGYAYYASKFGKGALEVQALGDIARGDIEKLLINQKYGEEIDFRLFTSAKDADRLRRYLLSRKTKPKRIVCGELVEPTSRLIILHAEYEKKGVARKITRLVSWGEFILNTPAHLVTADDWFTIAIPVSDDAEGKEV